VSDYASPPALTKSKIAAPGNGGQTCAYPESSGHVGAACCSRPAVLRAGCSRARSINAATGAMSSQGLRQTSRAW
jgi:hypothetical protein